MTLPSPLREEAIHQGWAVAHPLAGRPTVSPATVLVFAARDEADMCIVIQLLEASLSWAQTSDISTSLLRT